MAVNDNNDSKSERFREEPDKRLIRYAIADPGVPVDGPARPKLVFASPLELAKLDDLRQIIDGCLDEIYRRAAGESFEVPPVSIKEVLSQRFEETEGAA